MAEQVQQLGFGQFWGFHGESQLELAEVVQRGHFGRVNGEQAHQVLFGFDEVGRVSETLEFFSNVVELELAGRSFEPDDMLRLGVYCELLVQFLVDPVEGRRLLREALQNPHVGLIFQPD